MLLNNLPPPRRGAGRCSSLTTEMHRMLIQEVRMRCHKSVKGVLRCHINVGRLPLYPIHTYKTYIHTYIRTNIHTNIHTLLNEYQERSRFLSVRFNRSWCKCVCMYVGRYHADEHIHVRVWEKCDQDDGCIWSRLPRTRVILSAYHGGRTFRHDPC